MSAAIGSFLRKAGEVFRQREKSLEKNSEKLRDMLPEPLLLLRQKYTQHLSQRDLNRLMAEQFTLGICLPATPKNEKNHTGRQQLDVLNEALPDTHSPLSDELRQLADYIRQQIGDRKIYLRLLYQVCTSLRQSKLPYSLSGEDENALLAHLHELLRKKLAISLANDHPHILFFHTWLCRLPAELIEATENNSEAALLHESPTLLLLAESLLPNLRAVYCLGELPSRNTAGRQTGLFDFPNDDDCIHAIRRQDFTILLADLRSEKAFYPYQQSAYRDLDADIQKAMDREDGKVQHRERQLIRCLEKTGEPGVGIFLLERKFLTSAGDKPLRAILQKQAREIYILDLQPLSGTDAVCVFMLKRGHLATATEARIYYRKASAEPGDGWLNIQTRQQDYWIGLPESDFFSLLPLYAANQPAIFKNYRQQKKLTLADQWLLDMDEQTLSQKVRQFLKAYDRISEESGQKPNTDLPQDVKKLAKAGIKLTFDKQKIRKIPLAPFVNAYAYLEEKLLLTTFRETPAFSWHRQYQQPYGRVAPFSYGDTDEVVSFFYDKWEDTGISEEAIRKFQQAYRERSRKLPADPEHFPPAAMSAELEQLSMLSRDLPVIRKYPLQLGEKLEAARSFATQPERLQPLRDTIFEYREKVARLERDAVERRSLYQRIRQRIGAFEKAVDDMTYAQDEARRDYEAVSAENIFYYCLAVSLAPQYRQRYAAPLEFELPRIPLLPDFRRWVDWGKTYAELTHHWSDLETYPLRVEQEESERPRKIFSYRIVAESRSLFLSEDKTRLTLIGLPPEIWKLNIWGNSPLAHYLYALRRQQQLNRKLSSGVKGSVLNGQEKQRVQSLQQLCTLSVRLSRLLEDMQQADWQPL